MSTQTHKKQLPEQIAQHVYGQVPPRASAKAPRTGPPPASPHGAGHSAGIHPEDHPDWTDEPRRKLPQDIQTRHVTVPEPDDVSPEDNDAFYGPQGAIPPSA